MNDLVADVRHAWRRLAGTPGFTLLALATLALGIGANTALFSVVHGVLLKPLPFARPDQLYWVYLRHTSTDRYPFTLPEFCDYREATRTLEAVAGFANWSANLSGEEVTERLPGLRVSGNFFDTLGVSARVGRTLRPEDDVPGHEKVAVLSHGLWQRRFGADPGVVGRRVTLNGESFTVVGVLEQGFLFPVRDIELAVPLAPDQDPWRHKRDSTSFIRMVVRARQDAGPRPIVAELDAIGRRLQQEYPASAARKNGVHVILYGEELTHSFGETLWLLMAAVALLLAIACANLANLMLVRATTRRQELAIRRALGARPGLLVRPLLLESAILAGGGALLGVLLAWWSVPALVAMSPSAMPRAREIGVSLPVLLFSAGAAIASGLAFGLAPAWRAARADPNQDLKSESRGGTGADRGRARGLIVVAQVAVMVVLLTGASLLFQSFQAVLKVEPGFDQGVLTVRMSLPRKDYSDTSKIRRFYEELEARVRRLPGVVSVAATNHVPLNGSLASADYKVADRPPASEAQLPTADYRMVTPRFFEAMRIPIVAGRGFDETDGEGRPTVAVISQSLARQSFPDRDPVGRQLLVEDAGDFRPIEIVGVAGDVKHESLEAEAAPTLYVAYYQVHPSLLVWLAQNQFLVVRTSGDPLALGPAVRREVQAVDPSVASAGGRLSGAYVETATAARRFTLLLLGLFAALALVMAAVGIYGVVSYSVSQRTRETGLRLALGAKSSDVAALVLREGLKRSAIGIAAGLVAAYAAARASRSLLFQVGDADPRSYVGVVALLLVVTLAACLLPAWRAARLDPVRALRQV
jgi:predicted permease